MPTATPFAQDMVRTDWEKILTDPEWNSLPKEEQITVFHRWIRAMEETDEEWKTLPINERELIISNLRDKMGLGKEIGEQEAKGFTQVGKTAVEKAKETTSAVVQQIKESGFQKLRGEEIESTDLINQITQMETGATQPGFYGEDKYVQESYWNELIRPFLAEATTAAEMLNSGIGGFAKNLDELAIWLGSKLGMEPGGAFDEAFKVYMQNAEYWHRQSEKYDPAPIENMIGSATGGAVPGVAEFMAGVPYAAITGAKDAAKEGKSEALGALLGGAKRWFLGKIFHQLGQLRKLYAAPGMGAVFGLDALASGADPDEVMKAVGTGLLYGVGGKGGKYGIKDVIEMQKKWPKKVPHWTASSGTAHAEKDNRIIMDKKDNVYESHKSYATIIHEHKLDPAKIMDFGVIGNEGWPEWFRRKPTLEELISEPIESLKSTTPEKEAIVSDLASRLKTKGYTPSPKAQSALETAAKTTSRRTPPGVTKMDMLREMEKTTGIHVGFGKFRGKALGYYYSGIQAIRQKLKLDIPTTIHEVSHHLERYMNLRGLLVETMKSREFGKAEGELRKTAYRDAKDEIGEGMAEFYRLYVTHPEVAAKRCPQWQTIFEEALREHPEIQDLTVKLRTMWNDWSMMDEVQQARSFIVGRPLGKSTTWTIDEMYHMMVDELYPLKQLEKLARAAGADPTVMENPYLMGELARGWARTPENFLKWGTFKYDWREGIKPTGPSLCSILKDTEAKGEMPILDTYLFVRRTYNNPKLLDKWTRGTEPVFSPDKFLRAIETIEKDYPHLIKVADECTAYANRLLEFLKDSGRISAELYQMILDNSLYYAPLYEAMDADVPALAGTSKRKFANLFQPVKRIFEAQHAIYSPTQSLMYNTYVFTNIAERQRVSNALSRIARMPGVGKMIQRVPAPMQPTRVFKEEHAKTLKILRGGFKLADELRARNITIDELRADLKTKINKWGEKDPEKAAKYEAKLATLDQVAPFLDFAQGLDFDQSFIEALQTKLWRPNYTPKSNEILLFEYGEPVLYEVRDPKIRNALLAIDGEAVPAFVHFLAYPAKWLRAGATRFSPEFIIRNPMRDQWTAWIYSKYKPWWNPATVPYDFGRGLFHILGKTNLYQRFNASGGAHAALVSIDRDYLQKDLKKLLESRSKQITHLINPKNWLGAVQMLSELSEEGTRVGEYARAETAEKKGGKSGLEAMLIAGLEARDITLDFQRLGTKTKSWNMITAFFNAQVQGADKLRREITSNRAPEVLLKTFMGVTLPSIALWWAQKDDPYYQELPSWRKILFWNIITHKSEKEMKQDWEREVREGVTNDVYESWRLEPGRDLKHIWSFAKPFDLGIIFGSIPEGIANWLYMNDPKGMEDVLWGVLEGMAPNVIPTGGLMPLEWMSNWNRFFERPLVPRRKEELEPYAHYTNYTSDTLKAICKGLKDVPGLKELADPAKIQNSIQTWGGGGGRMMLNALDALTTRVGLVETEPKPWKEFWSPDTPGVRAFMVRMPGAGTKSIEQFYTDYEKERKKWQTHKVMEMKKPPGVTIPEPLKLRRMREIALTMNLLKEELNLVEVSKELDPKVKRAATEVLSWNMINLARMGLGKAPMLPRSLTGNWGLTEALQHAKSLTK